MFVTPGSYGWTVPALVTKMLAVVIGGAGGGGYAQKLYMVAGGNAVNVIVGNSGVGSMGANGSPAQAAYAYTAGGDGGRLWRWNWPMFRKRGSQRRRGRKPSMHWWR